MRDNKKIVLVGQKFGKLTVIQDAGKTIRRQAKWMCRCECGSETVVRGDSLLSGGSISCGCGPHNSNPQIPDLIGHRFGRLVVISDSKTRTKDERVKWNCLCDCGNKTIVNTRNLTNGITSSCGCLRKEMTKERFTTHGLSYTREYIKSQSQKRLEMECGLDSEWTYEMEVALEELFPVCVVCGKDKRMATDHVRPLSKGFGLKPGNAIRLCTSCNSRKHDKDLEKLDSETREKITAAANKFLEYWLSLNMYQSDTY